MAVAYYLLALSALASAIDLNVQLTPPPGTSNVVSHDYPALAMAAHAFVDYTGTTSPNTFSVSLIANLANRKGSPVHIRVGGTSGDKATFVPDQEQAIIIPPDTQPGTIPASLKLGPKWFLGFKNLDARWTYMAPLNIQNGQANAVASTKEALKNIGSNLDAIEIGNEYNEYGISVADLVSKWKDYAASISSQALAGTPSANQKIYQAPVIFGGKSEPWTVQNLFDQKINSGLNIKSASLHHYQDTMKPSLTLQKTFMNHTRIAMGLNYYSQPANYLAQNIPYVSLHLGEDNSLLGGKDSPELVSVFGSALWMADYLLYGMTRNVARINTQQITGAVYSSWRPVANQDRPPAVLPPYYGQVFVSDVMGQNIDNQFRIHSLDLGLDEFSAYTIFQNGKVAKLVLINFQEYRANSGDRPFQTVNITFKPDVKVSQGIVRRLTAPGADSTSGITWSGDEFTYESNGKPVQKGAFSNTRVINNNKFSIDVPASSAALITLS